MARVACVPRGRAVRSGQRICVAGPDRTVRTADSLWGLCAARAAARTLAAIFRSMSKVRSGQCFTHNPPRIHSYTTVGYICPSGGVEPSHPRAETARRRATRSGHARWRALVWLLVCRAAMAAPPEISDPGGLTGPQPQLLPHLRYHITRHVEHDQDPRAKHCSGGALLPRPEYDVRAAPHTSSDSHIVCCDELRQGDGAKDAVSPFALALFATFWS